MVISFWVASSKETAKAKESTTLQMGRHIRAPGNRGRKRGRGYERRDKLVKGWSGGMGK